MKISVVISTWNRAGLLDKTLASLKAMTVPDSVEWELLVVNNNCTDDTDLVLVRYQEQIPLYRLFEANPGLSNARNCAIDAFSGDVLIFLDDDIFVDPEFLTRYYEAIVEFPEAMYFGGSLDLKYEVDPPRWMRRLEEKLGDTYGRRDFGNCNRWFQDHEYPLGGNMAFRSDVIHEYRFDPNLGRSAGGLLGGEEVVFVDALKAAGHRGVAVGQARGLHFVPEDRISSRFIWEWHLGCGRTLARNLSQSDCKKIFGKPRWALWMYIKSVTAASCLSPLRNKQWLNAFMRAARARGVIDEYRQST